MQLRKTGSGLATMGCSGFANGKARQKADHGGGLAAQGFQHHALAVGLGHRAWKAVACQMAHQADEEGQFRRVHPTLEDGQDVTAPVRVDQEIGILHALGYALAGAQAPEVEVGEKARKLGVSYVGVNSHGVLMGARATKVNRMRGGLRRLLSGCAAV